MRTTLFTTKMKQFQHSTQLLVEHVVPSEYVVTVYVVTTQQGSVNLINGHIKSQGILK